MVSFLCRDGFYKSPFGAVRVGSVVHLRITTPPDLYICQAELVLNNGETDRVLPMAYETTTSSYNSFFL